MVHSIGGWMRGVEVKLWDPLRTRAIPERLRGVITTRRYTNPRLPTSPYFCIICATITNSSGPFTLGLLAPVLIVSCLSFEFLVLCNLKHCSDSCMLEEGFFCMFCFGKFIILVTWWMRQIWNWNCDLQVADLSPGLHDCKQGCQPSRFLHKPPTFKAHFCTIWQWKLDFYIF